VIGNIPCRQHYFSTLPEHSYYNRRLNHAHQNKQICQWSLWSEIMLYTTMKLQVQTQLLQFAWALHKYTSGQYVLNWCCIQQTLSFLPSSFTLLPHPASLKIRVANSTHIFLHSMDPQVSQMTIGCGISHNNTVHIFQVQFIPCIDSHNTSKGFTWSSDKLQINPPITYSR
jgi:hypothetical protein